ncbi:MAG: YidC/Oxa1 family membrane protein insertase [Clostridiaceae bacterium]|nr:YidC/Oxa1 family membrane protein insertase [Clostridiaceae bacterium]
MSRLLVIAVLTVFLALTLTGCITTSDGTQVNIFTLLIVRPFAWILRKIYDLIGSYGWSIIIFQLLAKALVLPLSIKGKKGMMETQRIQPKLKELENRYKNDKAKYQEEMSKLYQSEGISPMSGCLPTLLTFPIMIGLYWPISQPLTYLMNLTAAQIETIKTTLQYAANTHVSEMTLAQQVFENFDLVKAISPNIIRMDFTFLGMNLGLIPDWKVINLLFLIPIISGLTSFALTKLTNMLQFKSTGTMPQGQNSTMMYMMPLVSVWFGFTLPAGLGLYWIASNVTAAAQEYFMYMYFEKQKLKKPDPTKLPKEEKKTNGQKSRSQRKKH